MIGDATEDTVVLCHLGRYRLDAHDRELVIVSLAQGATLEIGPTLEVWGWAGADGAVDTVDGASTAGGVGRRPALEPLAGRAWQ